MANRFAKTSLVDISHDQWHTSTTANKNIGRQSSAIIEKNSSDQKSVTARMLWWRGLTAGPSGVCWRVGLGNMLLHQTEVPGFAVHEALELAGQVRLRSFALLGGGADRRCRKKRLQETEYLMKDGMYGVVYL